MSWFDNPLWVNLVVIGMGLFTIAFLIWGIRKASQEPFFKCPNCGEFVSVLDGRTKQELRRDHYKVCFD